MIEIMPTRQLVPGWVRIPLLITAMSLASPAVAQTDENPRWPGDIGVLGANALGGAISAGVGALLLHRSFADAFAKGALGGLLGFAGKQIASADWGAAPVIGRSLAAVGSSIVVNAARGRDMLDSLWIPAGPLLLVFGGTPFGRPDVLLNVRDIVIIASAAAQSDLRLDWTRSFSAVAPVFRTRQTRIRSNGEFVHGVAVGGVIVLDGFSANRPERVFNHEVVHLLQNDFVQVVWERPMETWLRRTVPGMNRVPVFLIGGILVPAFMDGVDWIGGGDGFFTTIHQAEAEWFENR